MANKKNYRNPFGNGPFDLLEFQKMVRECQDPLMLDAMDEDLMQRI